MDIFGMATFAGAAFFIAALILPPYISGLSKGERLGRVKNSDTDAKTRKKWIFFFIFLSDILIFFLGDFTLVIFLSHFMNLNRFFCNI